MSIQTQIKDKYNQMMAGNTDSSMESVMVNNEFTSSLSENDGELEGEKTESTGASSAGGYSQPLFGETEETTKVETKEATGASSSGSYETTSAWAKSTSKKDWKGKSKTQIPGGKFVQVKEKCKKFPYCNQGDINALKIFENDLLKKVITNVSKKLNINESVIKNIIAYEYRNLLS